MYSMDALVCSCSTYCIDPEPIFVYYINVFIKYCKYKVVLVSQIISSEDLNIWPDFES